MANKIFRGLCFDGGGMKGLFSAYFMKFFCQDAGIPGTKLYQHFNLFAGTDTGGIQALAYASGYSPDDMIEMFIAQQNPLDDGSHNTSSIFYPPVSTYQKILTLLNSSNESWYSNINLKSLLNQKFGQSRMFQLKANVLITAIETYTTQIPDVGTDIQNHRNVLFSNLALTGLEGQNYFVQDVALATSATPIYFPSVNIADVITPNSKFIDGSAYQNNPAGLMFSYANMLAPSANRICIGSVGTGLGTVGVFNPVPIPPPDFNNIYLLLDLNSLGIAGPQEAVHQMLEILALHGTKIGHQDFFYNRFNTSFDLAKNTEQDSVSKDFVEYIKVAAETQYCKDALKVQSFIQKCDW